MGRRRATADEWQQVNRRILDAIDIAAEYQAMGVRLAGTDPSGTGWIDCHAIGHDDVNPSAGINVGSEHPGRGQYKSFLDADGCLPFFDFAAQHGGYGTWQKARDHYAQKHGIALPATAERKRCDASIEWRDWNDALAQSWLLKKPGISLAALRHAGARIGKHLRHVVISLPVYGEHLTADQPCGWVCWDVTGAEIVVSKSGGAVRTAKMKTLSGSSGGWMGAGCLRALANATHVWVTEGPSDMLGLLSRFLSDVPDLLGQHAIICNSGGAGERLPVEILAHLSGKTVYVIPDCDVDGQRGCRRRAADIAPLAAEVRVIQLPFEIAPNHGKDLRDWLNEGHSLEELGQLAVDAEIIPRGPVADSETADGVTGDTSFEDKLLAEIGLDVLGEVDSGSVKVFSEFHRKVDVLRDVQKMAYCRLLQLCGPPAKAKVHDGDEDIPEMYSLREVRDAISLKAGFRRVAGAEVGLGCWQGLDKQGHAEKSVVLVGAGELGVYRPGEPLDRVLRPRYGGRLLDISGSTHWFNFDHLSSLIEGCDQQVALSTFGALELLLRKLLWKHPQPSPRIVASLVVASWIQTLWPWRPQIGISGKSDSGKSSLFNLLLAIYGPLAIKSSQSSAAGIRQALGDSARVLLCDEFDSSKGREEILKMLRSSGRGDQVLMGTTNHRGQSFTLRHVVWTAGIDSGLKEEPDKNRFIQLELIKPANKGNGLQWPSEPELAELGQGLLAIAVRYAFEFIEQAQKLRVLKIPNTNNRLVECYAVPAAVYSRLSGRDPVEVLTEFLGAGETPSDDIDDESRLLQDILAADVDLTNGGKRSVGQLIEQIIDDPYQITLNRELERKGLKVYREEEQPGQPWKLFVRPSITTKTILRGSNWEQSSIGDVLIRIDGSVRYKLRISGAPMWGVLCPLDAVTERDNKSV